MFVLSKVGKLMQNNACRHLKTRSREIPAPRYSAQAALAFDASGYNGSDCTSVLFASNNVPSARFFGTLNNDQLKISRKNGEAGRLQLGGDYKSACDGKKPSLRPSMLGSSNEAKT